jgi:hypothetical protein
MLRKWRTNITETSNANGMVNSSGHFRRYEITVTKGKSVKKQFYQLTKKGKPVMVDVCNFLLCPGISSVIIIVPAIGGTLVRLLMY